MALNKKERLVVGLMSGTSADGIDAVVAAIAGSGRGLRARVVVHVHRAFAPALRRRILRAALQGTVPEICELNFVLGEHFAAAAVAAIKAAGIRSNSVSAIGSHGQTLHHLPYAKKPSTLQIGEPAIIAERTGITTIADFRVGDMAAGGQGAPLVPYADWVLFTDPSRPRVVQNLGGIANLTFLPPKADARQVRAFDTGPGNMVLDGVVTALTNGRMTLDRHGKWAIRGRVSKQLLAKLMTHPFLKRLPPKTTGREDFGEPYIQEVLKWGRRFRLSDVDLIATVTAFTAASIADAYDRFVFPKLLRRTKARLQIILGGGGAKNPVLRRALTAAVNGAEVLTHEDFGIANEAKEALAFAILAHETLLGRPSNLPSATGARRPVVLGKIIAGTVKKY